MSEHEHDQPFEQEPDEIPLRAIVIAVGITVLVTVACIVYVAYSLPGRAVVTSRLPVSDIRPELGPGVRLSEVDRTLYERGAGFAAPTRAEQAERLESYGWVDRGKGVAHVPIERAMQLMVATGATGATGAMGATGGTGRKEGGR